jgi:hypothetical protein
VVPLRQFAGEFRLSAGITRVRLKANELHGWYRSRAWSSIALPASGDNEHRRSVLPGQLQRYGQAITRAGEH